MSLPTLSPDDIRSLAAGVRAGDAGAATRLVRSRPVEGGEGEWSAALGALWAAQGSLEEMRCEIRRRLSHEGRDLLRFPGGNPRALLVHRLTDWSEGRTRVDRLRRLLGPLPDPLARSIGGWWWDQAAPRERERPTWARASGSVHTDPVLDRIVAMPAQLVLMLVAVGDQRLREVGPAELLAPAWEAAPLIMEARVADPATPGADRRRLVEALAERLQVWEVAALVRALHAFALSGDRPPAPWLARWLSHPEREVRLAAARLASRRVIRP